MLNAVRTWLMNRATKKINRSANTFYDEDAIYMDIMRNLTDDARKNLEEMPKSECIALHHTTGRWVRNKYNLWAEGNPYAVLSDPMHDNFPDQVSHRIIERVWDAVHYSRIL